MITGSISSIDADSVSLPKRADEKVSMLQRSRETQQQMSDSPVAQVEVHRTTTPKVRSVSSSAITFMVDEKSGKPFIQVVDRESGKVLRQIPPEEARRLAEVLRELTGNTLDTLA